MLSGLFIGKSKKHVAKAIDGLLDMRKSETVAHGATGSADAIREVLDRREPQLAELLRRFEPIWTAYRLLVPLPLPAAADDAAAHDPAPRQPAYELHGYSPGQQRWRRTTLVAGSPTLPAHIPIIADADGKPLVSCGGVMRFACPSPDAAEELFLLDGAKKRAAVYVAFPSMAEQRHADVWAELGSKLFGEADADAAPPSTEGVTRPYRGLSSFGPEHKAMFFGREKQAQSLANRIRRHPIITLTGASGSGKSSLLHAGVFPLLDDHDVVRARPGSEPLKSLVRQISSTLGDIEFEPLWAQVQAAPESFGQWLETQARQRGRTIVLFVDQAEETFTLCREEEQQQAFGRAIASTCADPDAPTRVVLSLREDYFARIANLTALRDLYARQVEVVATPDRDELTRIVIAPALMFGFKFEDLALVEEMLDQVHGESAALAMVQFCADQLWNRRDRNWKRLTWDAYRSIGGVDGALAAHAEAVLAAMTVSQQATVRRMFLRLVTAEQTRAVVGKDDLLDASRDPDADVSDGTRILDQLLDARLVNAREIEQDDRSVVAIEVVHEALIGHWERFQNWLQQDAGFLQARARLEKAATRWDNETRASDLLLGDGKPLLEARELLSERRELLRAVEVTFIEASERRARTLSRLKRGAVAGLVLLTILAAGFGVFALQARKRAEQAAEQARQSEAVAVKRSVSLLTEQGRRELLDGRPLRALVYLQDAVARGGDNTALKSMLAQAAQPADALQAIVRTGGPSIYWVSYSDNGKELLVADTEGFLESYDTTTHASLRRTRIGERRVSLLRQTTDGQLLLAERNMLQRVAHGEAPLWKLTAHKKSIMALAESDDGTAIATGSVKGEIGIWSHDGERIAQALGHDKAVVSIAFSPNGEVVVSGSRGGEVALWDARTGALLRRIDAHPGPVERVAFDPRDNGVLLSVGRGGPRWYKADDGELLKSVEVTRGAYRSVQFGPTNVVVTAGHNNRGTLRWLEHDNEVTFGGHDSFARGGSFTPAAINAVLFSPQGDVVYTRGSDATVRVWDTSTGKRLSTLMAHVDRVGAIALSPDGKQLASAGLDGKLLLWRANRGAWLDGVGHSMAGTHSHSSHHRHCAHRPSRRIAGVDKAGTRPLSRP